MNITKLIIVLGLLFGTVLAQDATAEEQYSKGITAMEVNGWDDAAVFFKEAIALNTDFAPAMFQLAKISARNGDMSQTKDYLSQAIEADPENQEYRETYDKLNDTNKLMSQGARELDAGEFDNSYATYSQVVTSFPYMTEAIYSLGMVKVRAGDYDMAVEHFQAALIVNPGHEKAQGALKNVAGRMFNDGNNKYRRRDYDGALELYKKVVKTDPTMYKAYYQLGVVENRLKNTSGSIDAYQSALDIKPDFYQGWYALGLVKRKDGDTNGALKAYRKTVDINPAYAKAYCAMGDIYYDAKEYGKAAASCQHAIQADGTYAKPYITLATINIENKEYDQAIGNLEVATSLDRKSSKAWYKLAQVYNLQGNCSKAKSSARRSVDIKGKFGGAWIELGIAEWCNGSGNKTAALNALEKARGDRAWKTFAEYEMDKIRNPHKYQN